MLVIWQGNNVVDAFTKELFCGNQAAVCFPDEPLDDSTMQLIARENNFSETAFCVREGEGWHLRWFTPGGEIDLCGHATLATAHIVMTEVEPEVSEVVFDTMSGKLSVSRNGDLYEMDFPAYELDRVEVSDQMELALGARPDEAWMGRDLLCVFSDEDMVRSMHPDFDAMMELDGLLCHATAPGSKGFDCVSRSFAPKLGVEEDPVCGSGHCHIAPYWADRLGKKQIDAWQASSRGGELVCTVDGEHCKLAGHAVTFSKGEILI